MAEDSEVGDRWNPGQVSACNCFNLRQATRLVTQRYDSALRPAGLKATQFSVLAVAQSEGEMPLGREQWSSLLDDLAAVITATHDET